MKLVVRWVSEKICRTGLILQRLFHRFFSGNRHRIVTHRVKEVDALARGQNLLDPGQCQELGDHRRVDGILVLPKMALFLS